VLQLNPTTLAAVVDQALKDAAAHPRWVNAINRAVAELVQNPWIERQHAHAGLIIGSPSGNAYAANGICNCCSYTGIDPHTGRRLHSGGQACWHRAAARIVRLCDAAEAKAAIDADLSARRTRWAEAQAQIDELYSY
jgi:hypothetical protein